MVGGWWLVVGGSKEMDAWMDIKMDGTVKNGWMVGWIEKWMAE